MVVGWQKHKNIIITYNIAGICEIMPLSVTGRYCIKTAERLKLVFGTEATLELSYTVLDGNSGISKNKGTTLSCVTLV